MALLPITGLETHATGTTNLNAIINGNWEILEAWLGAAAGLSGLTTIAYAASIDLALSTSKPLNQCLLTGNLAVAVTEKAAGLSRILILVCDASGRTVSWPAGAVWAGEALTSLSAGTTRMVMVAARGTNDADLVLAQLGAGGTGGAGTEPSTDDQGITGLLATAQGDPICTPGLTDTPAGRVDVFINSQRQFVGDAVKTADVYFSGDSGTTARALADIVASDTCHLGTTGAAVGGTTTSDLIHFCYNV
jgi:hypothetical protein